MAREPDELVEMRRMLGAQLAAYRQAAELSQGQLAIATTVDRTTVAHIEKGRSRADEWFWTIADERCRAGGALLAGFHAWKAAKQDHEVRAREAQLAEARATAEELRARIGSAPGHGAALGDELVEQLACSSWMGSLAEDVPAAAPDEIVEQLARLLGDWIRAMNRRKLLQLLRWATSIAAAPAVIGRMDPDEQERFVRALGSPSRIDQRVLEHIDGMFRYCQLQEDALGSRAVLPIALRQRNLVDDLLTQCPENLLPGLLSIYSNMCTSIAYYFLELNDVDNARYHHEKSRSAAHDAGNTELAIYALGEWSYTESWFGNIPAGIDLAAAAQTLLDKTGDPLMRVSATQRAASAYAFGGQGKVCMAELDKAQASLYDSTKKAPTESPAYFFNRGYLASHRSECLLLVGKPEEAAASARSGLVLYDKSFMDGQAVCALHLGNSALQSGEIEEAARVVGDAADLATHTHSARLIKELRTTRANMQPWKETLAVKALDDRLTSYGLVMNSVR